MLQGSDSFQQAQGAEAAGARGAAAVTLQSRACSQWQQLSGQLAASPAFFLFLGKCSSLQQGEKAFPLLLGAPGADRGNPRNTTAVCLNAPGQERLAGALHALLQKGAEYSAARLCVRQENKGTR